MHEHKLCALRQDKMKTFFECQNCVFYYAQLFTLIVAMLPGFLLKQSYI